MSLPLHSGKNNVYQKIAKLLHVRRRRYFGHAARITEDRLPRKMLTAQIGKTHRKGRPRRTWWQTIVEDLDMLGEDFTSTHPKKVEDRDAWRRRIKGPSLNRNTHQITLRPDLVWIAAR